VPKYEPTLGVDYHTPETVWKKGPTELAVQLWDLVGAEKVGGVAGVFFKRAVGAVIVADLRNLNLDNVIAVRKSRPILSLGLHI
jgi:GTPase SAR1 family protein